MRLTLQNNENLQQRYEALKRWYKYLYSVNNSIVIYSKDSKDTSEQLVHPDNFPPDYEDAQQWFCDCRTNRGQFCWTVHVSGIGEFGPLKSELRKWNQKNKGWIEIDQLKARRVARLGWFENWHFEIQHSNNLKTYLSEEMEKEGISFEHEVFLQQVWSSGTQRATTTSLVLDVDVQAIDTATNFLLNHEFKVHFRMIKFQPFIKKVTVGQDIVKKLIE